MLHLLKEKGVLAEIQFVSQGSSLHLTAQEWQLEQYDLVLLFQLRQCDLLLPSWQLLLLSRQLILLSQQLVQLPQLLTAYSQRCLLQFWQPQPNDLAQLATFIIPFSRQLEHAQSQQVSSLLQLFPPFAFLVLLLYVKLLIFRVQQLQDELIGPSMRQPKPPLLQSCPKLQQHEHLQQLFLIQLFFQLHRYVQLQFSFRLLQFEQPQPNDLVQISILLILSSRQL